MVISRASTSKMSPSLFKRNPKADRTCPIRATSANKGTLRMRQSPEQRNVPAMITSAEFLAPLMFT